MQPDSVTRHNVVELPRKQIALVVEDDPPVQRAMVKALTQMKIRVLVASHYRDAVRHLEAHKIDIACIDIGLPNESGYELCEYIRGPMGLTRVPIVATSEWGTSHDMAHAENARANAFLLKPFAVRELAECVRSLLDRTSSRLPAPRHALALRFEPIDSLVA
jgi:two-component system chemotaxis response regulator CheY